jgi:guanosine-3',5'-bis(diphosphate) 3'-pyrophosphohydrolase
VDPSKKLQNQNDGKPTSPSNTSDLLFHELQTAVRGYLPNQDLSPLEKAYKFGADRHGPQLRVSGEPYITHPLNVALILTRFKVDLASITAAILHDVVEDTETPLTEIEQLFGKQVADLVDGMTKIGKIEFRSTQERLAENFRKMLFAMAKDVRVILIKLADRLHNMRTIEALPPPKRRRITQETLDIYAPLASRLGIYGIKSELEDLCLRQMKSDVYQELKTKIALKKNQRMASIEDVKEKLEAELKKYGFQNVTVYGRPKHFFSIYKKMIERHLTFEEVHDLFAFRIIVDTVKDCYEALGVVHAMWKPMPGRFKDYIAMPKANLYQSLHTTVIRPNGEPAEIQIRTHEMHETCESGIAAHWSYKDKGSGSNAPADPKAQNPDLKKFAWLRQMMEWQTELKDPEEFLEAVKVDLFDDEIFIFTPKGDVIGLPHGATALDFAFNVHSAIGLTTVGAKVNGRIVPIKKKLKSGDIVEILTSPGQKPNKEWLNFVTSSRAKNKIRSYLRSQQREKSRKMGRSMMEQACEARSFDLDKLLKQGHGEAMARAAKESAFDDMLASIGYGKLDAKDVLAKIFPEKEIQIDPTVPVAAPQPETKKTAPREGILVSGIDNVLVNFGRCCNPLPGEEIQGFITRGRGVTVHRATCSRALDLDPQRRVMVQWAGTPGGESHPAGTHHAFIRVITRDRPGVLADVTMAIAACGANIQRANIQVSSDLLGVLDFELTLNGLTQLQAIFRKVESLPEIVSVERRSSGRQQNGRVI